MGDRIQKALQKLSPKEQKNILRILEAILAGKWEGFDTKKLAGHSNVYRVRKGKLRIIFSWSKKEEPRILAIERRSDTTYEKW